jgi:hypothetical protein
VGGQWEVGGAKEGDGTVNMIKILNMQVLKCRNETYMVKKIKKLEKLERQLPYFII